VQYKIHNEGGYRVM